MSEPPSKGHAPPSIAAAVDPGAMVDSGAPGLTNDLEPIAAEPMRRLAHADELSPEDVVDADYVREDAESLAEEETEEAESDDFKARDDSSTEKPRLTSKRAPLARVQSSATTATNASSVFSTDPEASATAAPQAPGSRWRWLALKHRASPPVPTDRGPSREHGASIFSALSFQWISPLMSVGYQRPLEYNDLWTVNPDRAARVLSDRLEASFNERVQRGDKRPLLGAMHQTFRFEFYLGGICQLLAAVLQIMNPFILRYLLTFARDAYVAERTHQPGPDVGHGVGLVIGIVLIQVVQNTCTNQTMYRGMINGGQARAVLISLIFDKALRISGRAKAGGKAEGVVDPSSDAKKPTGASQKRSKRDMLRFWQKQRPSDPPPPESAKGVLGDGQGYNNGRIINLMSVDTYRIDQASGMFHLVWTAPISLLLTLALLLVNLREAALAGYGLLVIAMPLLMKSISSLIARRKKINKVTDQRVSLTQEVLSSVRFVKFFGWESSFLKRLGNIRSQEIRSIQYILAIRNGINAISISLPVFAAMLAFITYYYTSPSFSAPFIFSSLALFNSIRVPLNMLPLVIGQVTDAVSSVGRIEDFLRAEEEEDQCEWDPEAKHAIEATQASFTWERSPTKAKNEDMDATKNAKEAKQVAKAAKKAQRDSRRKSTGPEPDARLEDSSPASERRIFTIDDFNLTVGRNELVAVIGSVGSGKTSLLSALAGEMRRTAGNVRLGSSRAFCPQSAWIQNATVRKNILFGKEYNRRWYDAVVDACALRTDLDILPHGDMTEIGEKGITVSGGQKQRLNIARAIYFDADIVLMDDPLSAVDAHVGRSIMDNAICGLLKNKCRVLATHQLWVLNRCDRIVWMDNGRIQAIGSFDELMATNEAFVKLIATNAQEEKKKDGDDDSSDSEEADKIKKVQKKKGHRKPAAALMQVEERAVSSVSWGVYSAYIKASGSILVLPFVFLLLVCAQGANIVTSLWLSWWTSDKFGYPVSTYVAVYAALGVVQALLMFLFSIALSLFGTQASKVMLHNAMTRVLRAPMSFFDTTPLGRITNRFSKDIDTMDNVLTDNLRFFLITMAMIVSVFILIIAYYYYFAIALAPLLVLFVFASNFYRSSAREVKRHEAVLRSHVFSRFSEAVTGVSTIRAYGLQAQFSESIRDAVDDMDSAYFLTFANQRWLSTRLDMIGNCLVLTIGILVVTSRVSIDPSIAGLVLSYILSIVMMVQFTVRQLAEVENNMNSTERVHHYGAYLDEEPPLHLPNPQVTASWPEKGAIEFKDVEMRYRDGLPLVLKGLNLDVRGGERIGVVGRTGAGKSSIMTTLFRMVELSGGSIKIDGVDIATVGVEDLRQRLSIIPQDPTLFRGTVRSNLDPFGAYTDLELWNALRAADLVGDEEKGVDEKAGHAEDRIQLDTAVDEEGLNFSLGQRQLMALARALVRGSRVIVCDEATSSVDMETDDRIQRTMASGFRGKTLLCIAHRLRTILNYDRIVVMDAGTIAECDAPLTLFEQGGIFRSMCDRSNIRRSDFAAVAAAAADGATDKEIKEVGVRGYHSSTSSTSSTSSS